MSPAIGWHGHSGPMSPAIGWHGHSGPMSPAIGRKGAENSQILIAAMHKMTCYCELVACCSTAKIHSALQHENVKNGGKQPKKACCTATLSDIAPQQIGNPPIVAWQRGIVASDSYPIVAWQRGIVASGWSKNMIDDIKIINYESGYDKSNQTNRDSIVAKRCSIMVAFN